MQVETFECTETRQETSEQSAEALRLIEELGLDGQKPEADAPRDSRNPYRMMKSDEQFVYSVLCPDRCKVEAYKDGPIPLEVLKTLAYAKTLGVFAGYEVWAASAKSVKDPVLVGYTERTSWGSLSGGPYIIARWGEELLPLEVLAPDAIRTWWNKRMDKIRAIKAECELALTMPPPSSIPSNVDEPYSSRILHS